MMKIFLNRFLETVLAILVALIGVGVPLAGNHPFSAAQSPAATRKNC